VTRPSSEGRLKAIAVREKRLKLQRDELKAEQAREAEARQAASPLLDAYEEAAIRATLARQLPPGWAMARLAQLAKVAQEYGPMIPTTVPEGEKVAALRALIGTPPSLREAEIAKRFPSR
jgi:hypothetical protein